MTDPKDPHRPDGTDRPDEDEAGGPAVGELRDLEIDLGADLGRRVQRDINRRTLVADSIDFSFNVMLETIWEHLRSVIESWPAAPTDDRPEE